MPNTKTITIRELLQDIDAATARMGLNNPHRLLLIRCSYGLIEMTQRAHKVEATVEPPDFDAMTERVCRAAGVIGEPYHVTDALKEVWNRREAGIIIPEPVEVEGVPV